MSPLNRTPDQPLNKTNKRLWKDCPLKSRITSPIRITFQDQETADRVTNLTTAENTAWNTLIADAANDKAQAQDKQADRERLQREALEDQENTTRLANESSALQTLEQTAQTATLQREALAAHPGLPSPRPSWPPTSATTTMASTQTEEEDLLPLENLSLKCFL